MRALLAALALLAAVGTAWAGSPLVDDLQAFSTRYNENPKKIDELKAALEKAAESQAADVDTLLALAQVCFMYGDVRATTEDEKLAAYDRGRQADKSDIALAPRSPNDHAQRSTPAKFCYLTNTGRWAQTKVIMRSLFLLPTVKEAMQTALAIDPGYAPAYALGGSIYYEVPSYAGGDLDRSEAMFRKGLELDPRYTNMRLGLARTLLKKGRTADARRELEAVLGEKAPSNPADWAVKDVPQAKAILATLGDRS